jgi:hypothetical protein
MMESVQPTSIFSKIEEFEEVSRRMEDEEVTEVLEQVVRMIANPDISMLKAPLLIVKLEAMATKFGIMKTYYTSFEKGNVQKKNMYWTLAEKTKDLADAVKYLAR